jgi:hypothetical protein
MQGRRDGRDVRSMTVMCMISIIMAKKSEEVMRVEGVSEGYVIHVRWLGSTPACSDVQAAEVARVVSIGMIVTYNMSVVP